MSGKYIVIEGGDGVGKDTQLALLQRQLAARNIPHKTIHEPYDRVLGDHMIAILKDADPTKTMSALDPWQQAMLYNAARRGIMQEDVAPTLQAGEWVIASRNYTSTLVYQGYGGDMDPAQIKELEMLCRLGTVGIEPDLTIILDLDPEVAKARQAGKHRDSFERSSITWRQKIREGYLQIAEQNNYVVIAGGDTIDEVALDIWAQVEGLLD